MRDVKEVKNMAELEAEVVAETETVGVPGEGDNPPAEEGAPVPPPPTPEPPAPPEHEEPPVDQPG